MSEEMNRRTLSPEVLEAEQATPLPDREALSLVRAEPMPPTPIGGTLIGPPAEQLVDPSPNA